MQTPNPHLSTLPSWLQFRKRTSDLLNLLCNYNYAEALKREEPVILSPETLPLFYQNITYL